MDLTRGITGSWYLAESQCQVHVVAWQTFIPTQVIGWGWGMVSFIEINHMRHPPKA